jgi:hypothetical protein
MDSIYIYIYIQAFEHLPKYPISTWVLEQLCVGLAILTSNMKASSMCIINLNVGMGHTIKCFGNFTRP